MYITHYNKGLQGAPTAWWLFLHIAVRSYTRLILTTHHLKGTYYAPFYKM